MKIYETFQLEDFEYLASSPFECVFLNSFQSFKTFEFSLGSSRLSEIFADRSAYKPVDAKLMQSISADLIGPDLVI